MLDSICYFNWKTEENSVTDLDNKMKKGMIPRILISFLIKRYLVQTE